MSVSNTQLPVDLRQAIARDVGRAQIERAQVLESLTAIRTQTALDQSGVPKAQSLRTVRVILRGTPFEATLRFAEDPTEDDLAILAACVKAFRRAGTGMNRGSGLLEAHLLNTARERIDDRYFAKFRSEVIG